MKMFFEFLAADSSGACSQDDLLHFSICLQQALLLGLKEQGYLTEFQYQYAAETLQTQYYRKKS